MLRKIHLSLRLGHRTALALLTPFTTVLPLRYLPEGGFVRTYRTSMRRDRRPRLSGKPNTWTSPTVRTESAGAYHKSPEFCKNQFCSETDSRGRLSLQGEIFTCPRDLRRVEARCQHNKPPRPSSYKKCREPFTLSAFSFLYHFFFAGFTFIHIAGTMGWLVSVLSQSLCGSDSS